jgi:hypothetical protein
MRKILRRRWTYKKQRGFLATPAAAVISLDLLWSVDANVVTGMGRT